MDRGPQVRSDIAEALKQLLMAILERRSSTESRSRAVGPVRQRRVAEVAGGHHAAGPAIDARGPIEQIQDSTNISDTYQLVGDGVKAGRCAFRAGAGGPTIDHAAEGPVINARASHQGPTTSADIAIDCYTRVTQSRRSCGRPGWRRQLPYGTY